MEAENKKLRDAAKKERNEEIRVGFIEAMLHLQFSHEQAEYV